MQRLGYINRRITWAAWNLADMDRYSFLDLAEGVTLHTQTPSELESELENGDSLND